MKKYDDVSEWYKDMHEELGNANELLIRGSKVKEIIAPQVWLNNPRQRIVNHQDRKWNKHYAIMESMLLFADVDDLKYYEFLNKNMKNYSDDGIKLYGSYGKRIAKYIPSLISKIKNDVYTRQAAITILQAEDISKNTKDLPCTLSLQFLWRDGTLNMIVNMRSNDIMWGFQYDMFMFTVMQEIIANECGMDLGWYLHRPASLHVYEHHYELFDQIVNKYETITMPRLKYDYEGWMFKVDLAIRLINMGMKEDLKNMFNNL